DDGPPRSRATPHPCLGRAGLNEDGCSTTWPCANGYIDDDRSRLSKELALASGQALDTDHPLRLRYAEHADTRSVVLDAQIDLMGPLVQEAADDREFFCPFDRAQHRDCRHGDDVGERMTI